MKFVPTALLAVFFCVLAVPALAQDAGVADAAIQAAPDISELVDQVKEAYEALKAAREAGDASGWMSFVAVALGVLSGVLAAVVAFMRKRK